MTITYQMLLNCSAYANAQSKVRVPWMLDGAIITLGTEPLAESPDTAAWYDPKKGDVTVNVDVPGITDTNLTRFYDGDLKGNAGLLWGLIAHEAAHSAWTKWVPADLDRSMDPQVVQAMVLFEEIRIEKRAVDRGRAEAIKFLRQSFAWLMREIVKDPSQINTHPFALAHTWTLAYGRYLAGIADRGEVEAVDSLVRTALGDDTVDTMIEILSEATFTSSDDIKTYTELGEEWVELLRPLSPPIEEPVMVGCIIHGQGAGIPGAGDEHVGPGGGGCGYTETDDELAAVLRQAVEEIGQSMDNYVLPPQPETPLANPQATATKVFGSKTVRGANWGEEEPKPELRAHSLRLARTLESLSLPSVTLTHTPSAIPPGRLRSREMVRQGAERSMGMMSTATPWSRAKRRHQQTRPVIVGIATDTSGSMGYAEEFVAEFAWMMSTAGHRIGARTAAVTFGNKAERVVGPGEIMDKVAIRAANGGHEDFDHAMAALEGVLHFEAAASAAKVLFIVSDGNLVKDGEMLRAQKWLRNITRSGTLIVWLGCESQYRATELAKMADKRLVHFTDCGKNTTKMMASMEATVIRAARSL